jgi:beta-glucosidase
VLLKNDDDVLPLPSGKKLALIGSFAKTPRYQGAGSSQVNPTRESNPFDELGALVGAQMLLHADGCDSEGETNETLLADATAAATAADVAVVFAGLPESHESEGFDRGSIDLPAGHVRMIEAVARVQAKVVVVLMNGSAVAMPWADRVKGIVEAWLGGQAGAGAIADVLMGRVNPSGKLGETFPADLAQTPTYAGFPGRGGHALYGEGVFVGYRHYDARRLQPQFPFGFGLSYTRFAYTGMRCSAGRFDADGEEALTIEVSLRNVGAVAGREVVQLYVHERAPSVARPPNELRAFEKVSLEPGEERTLRFTLGPRDFAHYDVESHAWVVRAGSFDVRVGGSSRDLPLVAAIDVTARRRPKRLTRHALVRDLKEAPNGEAHYAEVLRALGFEQLLEAPLPVPTIDADPASAIAQRKARMAMFAFADEMPIAKLPAMSQGRFTEARLGEMIGQLPDEDPKGTAKRLARDGRHRED